MCCPKPCLIRAYVNKQWVIQCLNCHTITPE